MIVILNGKISILGRDFQEADGEFLSKFLYLVRQHKGAKK